jgi:hypothetical protein
MLRGGPARVGNHLSRQSRRRFGMVSNLARDHTAHGYPNFASRLRSNHLSAVTCAALYVLAYESLSRDMRA